MKRLARPLLAAILLCPVSAPAGPAAALPPEDAAYLRTLMRETWDYIDAFRAPETGFPCDANTCWEKTNTTNVGLYLASLCAAHKLGYIGRAEAESRVVPIMESLERIERWNGLYNNWLSIRGDTRAAPGSNNISDFNKLPAGVIMVRQTFPRLKPLCDRFLNRIDWTVFHSPADGRMYYDFDIAQRKVLNPVYISRGEDKLLGAFMVVAGGAPAGMWDRHWMSADAYEEKEGLRYLKPGWQGGGLFMQYICGLFLDERATLLGRSAADFAFAQVLHGRRIGSPVWGWSASNDPEGGYLGMGAIVDHVVTPHASVLAVEHFPREVVRNLRYLERLGVRAPYRMPDGTLRRFGFRDAVNLKNGAVDPNYLVLDQAMLFLSLANFLEDGLVRRTFMADPFARGGLAALREYRRTEAERRAFTASVRAMTAPSCAVLVGLPDPRETAAPGEEIRFEPMAANDTARDRPGARLSWRWTDGDGRQLDAGEAAADLPRGRVASAGERTFRVPAGLSRRDRLRLDVRLLDADGAALAAQVRLFPMRNELDLSGGWLFAPGDDEGRAAPRFDDGDWRTLQAPGAWEKQGVAADGFAWYRRRFTPDAARMAGWEGLPLAVVLGGVDDADEVFLDGVRLGGEGRFPPSPATAAGRRRVYPVPTGLLRAGCESVLAVRVHDSGGEGGITKGPILLRPLAFERALPPERPVHRAARARRDPFAHPAEWDRAAPFILGADRLEAGELDGPADLSAEVRVLWDKRRLYVKVRVRDDGLIAPHPAKDLYKGDAVELFLNPDGEGLVWGDAKDVQFGLAAPAGTPGPPVYDWFRDKAPAPGEVLSSCGRVEGGYEAAAAFAWDYLKVRPRRKGEMGFTAAVHDIDDKGPEAKLTSRFAPRDGKIDLGTLLLE